MSPTEIIKEWFEAEPEEVQGDVAFLIIGSLTDDTDLAVSLEELVPRMRDWLTAKDLLPFRTVGKAVSFAAAFDFHFGERLTASGWDRTRNMFEQVIEDAKTERMVAVAKEALSDMPRKIELWGDVGSRWQSVKERLSPAYLERWLMQLR